MLLNLSDPQSAHLKVVSPILYTCMVVVTNNSRFKQWWLNKTQKLGNSILVLLWFMLPPFFEVL